MNEVVIYEFECSECGKTGSATYKVNLPCTDCGGELKFRMIVPQGKDEQ